MATIAIELGKVSSKNTREVYLLVRQGKSRRRVKTGVKLAESEYSKETGRIKSPAKARIVEKLRNEFEDNLEAVEQASVNAETTDGDFITSQIIKKQEVKTLDFFTFTEEWLNRSTIKSAKNYRCMLNTLEAFNGRRKLLFQDINVRFLKDFEVYLKDRPRAKSMYIGLIRHLFREAMIEYNTDDETVIKTDPFQRYKAPRQVMKKGVRALSLEDFMKVVNYKPEGAGRKLLAHDPSPEDVVTLIPDGLDPVPLTAELLEKNGWVKTLINPITYIHPLLGDSNKVVFDGEPHFREVEVLYVHHLQNLLAIANKQNVDIDLQTLCK
jgi:hypothetical protein